jgi:exonuclease III
MVGVENGCLFVGLKGKIKIKNLSMIGATWNIRSLGRPGRKQAITEFIAEHKIEFIGFQETKKEKIDPSFLSVISGSFSFTWFSLPAKRTAGGILVGFRDDLFDIIDFTAKKYCVIAVVKSKADNFVWQWVVVYGSAYAEYKLEFIAELHDVMEATSVPTLISGDFNLVRDVKEKSNEKD